REFSYARLRKGNTIMHPATFLKREAFSRFGLFDTELKFAMDYDMWLRIGKEEQPLTVAAPLACFRAHEGSISTANQRKVYDEVWKIRKGRCGYGFFEQRWRFLVFLAKKIYYGVLFPRPYA
ncbi:MAG: hypothetical protein OET90_12125, partial [Desulfuromonadales bacterium]|nr:hypothetical protein [Desulfuromonadales bacterium]